MSRFLFCLEIFIRSLGHLALDQSKKLTVSLILISRIFACVEQIFRSLEQFSLVILNFPQSFQNLSGKFFSQISLFLTPASTITAIVPARININTFKSIFLLFFLIESFDVLIECFELFITGIFHQASL